MFFILMLHLLLPPLMASDAPRWALLPALLLLAHACKLAATDWIDGCGGFIEASPTLAKLRKSSDPKLDYSHVIVELHTLDGLVKDRTHCAPNGYYFVPVYDKGTFALQVKGIEGWSWEPSQVTVVVDANGCNGNDDINFRYTGFTLSGKVLGGVGGESCLRKEEGPAGVKVTSTPVADGEILAEETHVVTSSGGSFKFTNLVPGQYVLNSTHPKLKVELTGSPEVTLGWGNGKVDDIFFIPGYNVEGSVVSQGNPILGVYVYLYSDDVIAIPCIEGPGNPPWPELSLCHAVSDANGKFAFSSVPCGTYRLMPYYKGENTVFDVSPPSLEISVSHGGIVIPKPFQVTGFSVGGCVVDSQGNGVEGVRILVNDVERVVTDSKGFYKLDQVTSTHYTIQAHKPFYKFSTLENFMVLPNMASIPNISATHYDLCGFVILNSTSVGKRQVALTHGPANVKPQTKRVNASGFFCFEVPPGEYRVSPLTTTSESSSGLLFSPPYQDIIVNGPIRYIAFTQAQVNIYGSVKCKEQCRPQVCISLTPVLNSGSTGEKRKMLTCLTSESDGFAFERVLPGKYNLEIRCESLSNVSSWDDEWCWEQRSLAVAIGTDDLKGIQFIQKGFWIHIESTHSEKATILQPDGQLLELQIEKGLQEVCVEASGIYELQFVRPCIFFGTFRFQFDTSNPKPIQLIGQKYRMTGKVYIDAREYPTPDQLIRNTAVMVWKEDGSLVDRINHFHHVIDSNGIDGALVLEYHHWGQMGDGFIFSPNHLCDSSFFWSLEQSRKLYAVKQVLFYPKEAHVHVMDDGCQPEIPTFFGRVGRYIEGSVMPPLEGVNITIIAKADSLNGNLRKGDVASVVMTGDDGLYVAGPLYDDTDYIVQAAKVGYHLKLLSDYTFSSQKLGQIRVHVVPGEGAEDQLPAVLLSLSGDDGYRKNAITSSGAVYSFDNLFPGSLFLRPLLKEYIFSPAAQAIELGSGQLVEVNFVAHRMAYSVLGTVTSLSGKAEEGIPIEARSEIKGYYEETITDKDGRYRLRGLHDQTNYVVKVILKEDANGISRIERASPSSVTIQVGMNDTAGVDFIVFDQFSTTILTGYAEGVDLEKWRPYLTISIAASADPSRVVQAVPLPLSYFFEVQGLARGRYTVQLLFQLSDKTHNFRSEEVIADLERHTQVHIGAIKFSVEERHRKQDLTPAPILPFIVGVMVIAIFASMPRLKDGYLWVVGSGLSAAPPKDSRKPLPRKRTY